MYIAYGIEFHIEDCANTTSYAYTYPEVLSQKYAILYVSDGKFSINKSLRMYVQPPILVPTIESLSVTSGAVAGGTEVTITGQNFTNASSVKFGDLEATFTLISSTEITTTSPARSEGTVGVTVTTPGGTSGPVDFTYIVIPPPALTSISPTEGSIEGGTVITITGTNLSDATGVDFGDTAAQSFTVVSDTEVSATSPASGEGTVGIVVTTPSGTSDSIDFTYVLPIPVIDSISPTEGFIDGGTIITITGSYFTGATGVDFGDTAVQDFTVISDTEISATSPLHSEGVVDVTVTTPSGVSNAVTFDYVLPPNEPPIINSFSTTTPSIYIGEEAVFSWSVTDLDDDQLRCSLDLGDGDIFEVVDDYTNDCRIVTGTTMPYFIEGNYTVTLTVHNNRGKSASQSLNLTILPPTIQDIEFSSTAAQNAWQFIQPLLNLDERGWLFDTSSAVAWETYSGKSGIMIMVEEQPVAGESGFIFATVIEDNVVSLYHYDFNLNDDVFLLSNILDGTSAFFDQISQYENEPLSQEQEHKFNTHLETVLLDLDIDPLAKLYDQINTQSLQLQDQSSTLETLSLPKCRDCSSYKTKYNRAKARRDIIAAQVARKLSLRVVKVCRLTIALGGSVVPCVAGIAITIVTPLVIIGHAEQTLLLLRREYNRCLAEVFPSFPNTSGIIGSSTRSDVVGLVWLYDVTGLEVWRGNGRGDWAEIKALNDQALLLVNYFQDLTTHTVTKYWVNSLHLELEAQWEINDNFPPACFP